MDSSGLDRRAFLAMGAKVGVTACGLCMCSRIPATIASQNVTGGSVPDPEKLTYCGYTCPSDCKFLRGTLEDDFELKRQAWELWKIEERFGVAFDPDQAVCHGCKTIDQPEGIVVSRCDVRPCTREKKLDSCIQCPDLTDCDKDLWKRFPQFKEKVVKMRELYLERV
jgi:hypothetical protein